MGVEKVLPFPGKPGSSFSMKVYSRPEVLEDHIAPAFLSLIGIPNNDSSINLPTNGSTGVPLNNIIEVVTPSTVGGDLSFVTPIGGPEPEAPSSIVDFSDFNIRTVRIGADGSLIGEPTIDFRDVLFQALLGNASVDSTLTDATLSLLADELSVSNDVIEAIESAVAEDRSAALVGLSSEEFERTSGSAFLTSL